MRHLWSFLAGLVVAPITWVLVTLGQDGSSRTVDRWVETGTFNTANLIEPAVYLGVGGVLLGLLGTLRFSPLGPLVAGALLVTPYIGMFVAPFSVRDAIPHDWKVFGDPLPLRLPVENGTLFLIGLLLLMATFSVQRWRPWPTPTAAATSAPAPAADAGPGNDDFTLTDWPSPAPTERDTAPLTLGYPTDSTPTEPLPRRVGGESPWSAPPRGQPRPEDDTTEIR
ncbi:hypothetical protein [Micromonospora tarensis]|uniref:Uncharacterized protein n=1 Tax=Micromonospora tarensis TaxID=2806100 RepID=A0ABS1YBF5_9ACTN|nr:hypothetical protein [Micromonospora tarensis]MBM0274728.1 hypothetical protein [Micromonospora tarensis]